MDNSQIRWDQYKVEWNLNIRGFNDINFFSLKKRTTCGELRLFTFFGPEEASWEFHPTWDHDQIDS